MRLEDIKCCHVCHGINFKPLTNVSIEDIMTNEVSKKDVLLCNDCDTIHYIDGDKIAYEFSFKINNIGNHIRSNVRKE